jgi:hypothetical protein
MNFLAAVAAKVVQWLISKGAALGYRLLRFFSKKKAAHLKTDIAQAGIENAKTKEELDKAVDDIARDF